MSATLILEQVARAGITLAADGSKLIAQPASRLTPELRTAIREHKAEILFVLTQPQQWELWQAAHPSPGTVPLTAAEREAIESWLADIGETKESERLDVLRIAERFPDTRAWLLSKAASSCNTRARLTERARETLNNQPEEPNHVI